MLLLLSQGLLHSSSTLLDVGQFDTSCSDWLATAKKCAGTRMPPKAPANFTKELELKHFTTGRVDHDFVNKKYAKTFLEVRADYDNSFRACISYSYLRTMCLCAAIHNANSKSSTAEMMKTTNP